MYSKKGLKVLSLDKTETFHQYSRFIVSGVTIYLVYRPPSGGSASIEALSDLIRSVERNSILIGDFNIPEIDWQMGQARGRGAKVLEAAEDKLLEQMIDFSTHIRGNILNLLLTNITEQVLETAEAGRLGHSDHSMILVTVAVKADARTKAATQPNWYKADWGKMREELGKVDWRGQMVGKSGQQAWELLKNKIQEAVDKHVPARRTRNQNRPAWLSQDILGAIRRKKRLWKKAKVGDSVEEYKKEEKRVRNMIRKAKKNFEKKIADGSAKDGGAKRKFYAYVKQRTKCRSSVGPLKDGAGRAVSGNEAMAKIFNEYFSSVFTREDVSNVPDPEQHHRGPILTEVKVTVKKVKEKIKKLRKGAAAGPDKIGPQLLQELVDTISSPLATVMRRSLEDGTMPDDWRTANVTPIFKKGAKHNPANYRPVSLTSVCCKMLEAIIKDDMVSHLDKHRLIRRSQHGFMRGKSCASNLVSFLDKITAAADKGEAADIVFLDFAKAFDKVPVKRLLRKVRAHRIGGQLFNWIKAWLTDRRQRVVLNGDASDWAEVLSGVPQGSVLGPLLFLIFINDLEEKAVAELVYKFADDTKVAKIVRDENDQAELQRTLDELADWAERWGMSFNVQKCKVMHVGHANKQYEYSMNATVLETTTEERDLGVVMSATLKPKAQCAKAARTAQTVLSQIARAFHFRDKNVFLKLYKQYVRPHLEFAAQAWSPWTAQDKEVLEKVQQRAVGMISGLKAKEYEERLKKLELTTLEERRHQADMAMVYKVLTGRDQVDHEEWFTRAGEAARATRAGADPMNIRIKHGRLDIRRNFFTVRVTELWNMIPSEIKNQRTVDAFKSAYAQHRAQQE